ncbi:MAG: rRNA ((1915)-N(3))-methyltransferase RlmH [Pseudomonadota bacterium]|jgi:23S rRNA (pseudouridine1915-N3)-methyltransferase
MKLVIIAVGTRMPAWADAAFAEFAGRMPREAALSLIEIKAEPRSSGKPAATLMAQEAVRIEAAIPPRARIVVLDERGDDLSTRALSQRMSRWREDGGDVVFLIGGPDGLDATLKQRAAEAIRLSSLTLPHAFARVLLAEQLYRAWSVLHNHPYHRD